MEREFWRAIEHDDVNRIRELTRQGVWLSTWPPFNDWTAQSETCWLQQCSVVVLGRIVSLAVVADDRNTALALLGLGRESISRQVLRKVLYQGRVELLPPAIDSMRLSGQGLFGLLVPCWFTEACDEVLLPRLAHLSPAALGQAPEAPSLSVIRLLTRVPAAFDALPLAYWRQLGRIELSVLRRAEEQIKVASAERRTTLLVGAITSVGPIERLDYLLPLLIAAPCAPAVLSDPCIMCVVAPRADLADYAPIFDCGFVITTEALQLAAVVEAMFYQLINRASLEAIRGLKLTPEMCEAAREFVGLLVVF